MTNVMDAFGHLDTMTQPQLFERRSHLVSAAPNGDYRQLSDEALQELVAISRVLRRKSSPATARANARRGSFIPTLDSI